MAYSPSDKWVLRWGSVSILVDRRSTVLFLAICLGLFAAVCVALGLGSDRFEFLDVFAAVFKNADIATRMIIFDIRLPRIVATLSAGFAFGLAGAMSQTVFRNRLATPDILGINEGATLAIVAFVVLGGVAAWPFWIAPIGALIAVSILYLFCLSSSEQGSILLIVGICLMEFLRAIVEFLMSMGAMHEVQGIYIWLQGNFVGQGYRTSLPVLAVIAAMLPLQLYVAKHLYLLRLSPSLASSLGADLWTIRIASIVTIAVLAALGASIGGPVAFIAMAAPILTSMVVKERTPALWCAALVGSVLLLIADTLARWLSDSQDIAVGVVTRVLGGVFLLALLLKSVKRRSA